ncbi:MAG: acyl-CoA carboxylase subunit epsilon [Nocardioides sp.]
MSGTAGEGQAGEVAEGAPDAPTQPLLRVINADASPEEIAAIVAVFSAMGGAAAPARKPRPTWNHPERLVRRPLAHGLGGWRSSSLPR